MSIYHFSKCSFDAELHNNYNNNLLLVSLYVKGIFVVLFVVHGALNSIITLKVISIPANCINWRITKSGGKYILMIGICARLKMKP